MSFEVTVHWDRVLRYSTYFKNMETYNGVMHDHEIILPGIMNREEYVAVFTILSAYDNYEYLLAGLLGHFLSRSLRALVQFAIYFLNDQIIVDLVRAQIRRDIRDSHGIIAEMLNIVGCKSHRLWPNGRGKYLTLSQLINEELSFSAAVSEETMLAASVVRSRSHDREMISSFELRRYISKGIQRQALINRQEIHECCFCHGRQRAMRVKGWKLTGGLQRTPCCASPIHAGCFWTMLECHFICIHCQSPLEPDTGRIDGYMSNWALAMDRMRIRDFHGISRWQDIPPPRALSS